MVAMLREPTHRETREDIGLASFKRRVFTAILLSMKACLMLPLALIKVAESRVDRELTNDTLRTIPDTA